jgi:NADH-quinone oxidoreductase subunit L
VIAAGITGFYMTRLIAMTFFGKARWPDDAHPHESPPIMTIPLMILAVGSAGLGMALLFWGDIESWLEPVVGFATEPTPIPTSVMIIGTLAVIIIGVIIGWVMYARRPVPEEAPHGNWLTRAARDELYGNQVNDVLVVEPTLQAAKAATWFDRYAIDGFVNGIARFIGQLSSHTRKTQSGFARGYALAMVGGAFLIVLALLMVRL